jgi:hypothetical protein
MKCICGYEGHGISIFVGQEKGNNRFSEHGIYGNSYKDNVLPQGLPPVNGDLVSVFACPKCGTLKVDFNVNPLG